MSKKRNLIKINISPEHRRETKNKKVKKIMEEHLMEIEAMQMQQMLKDDDCEMLKEDNKQTNTALNSAYNQISEQRDEIGDLKEKVSKQSIQLNSITITNKHLNTRVRELKDKVDRLNKYNRFDLMDIN